MTYTKYGLPIKEKKKLDCALVADITSSRSGSDSRRKELVLLLEKARVKLNEIFKDAFLKEVVFSSGDSIQGLFHNIEDAFLYARLLQKIFNPEIIRVGFGLGDSISAWDSKDSNYSSGSAYIYANNALHFAKKQNTRMRVSESKISDINIIMEAISLLHEGFTEYHDQIDLMIEVMMPFANKNVDVTILMDNLIEIISYKLSLKTFQISKKQNSDQNRMIEFIANIDKEKKDYFHPIYLDPPAHIRYPIEQLMNIEGVNLRGMVSDLALLTNTSKSNMSQRISSANITKIREYEAYLYYKLKGME